MAAVSRPPRAFLLTALPRPLVTRLVTSPAKALVFALLYVCLPKYIARVAAALRLGSASGLLASLWTTTRNALHPNKFPVFSARLVLGINAAELVLHALLRRHVPARTRRYLVPLVAAGVSARHAFRDYQLHIVPKLRAYSKDLTLLLAVRAADTATLALLGPWTPPWLSAINDAVFFDVCTLVIMFCWFHCPERLPRLYANWITSAANMDPAVVHLLRGLYRGDVQYGKQVSATGALEDELAQYAAACGMDPACGDVRVTCPVPCRVVHSNLTSLCELHALWRLWRGVRFGLGIYLPLNAFMTAVRLAATPRLRNNYGAHLRRILGSSARLSLFLGTFIALNWYGVCFMRLRAGPAVLTPLGVDPVRYDDLLGVALGLWLCGWALFIETKLRRRELALFCAPKALAAVLPTDVPPARELKVERAVFAVSFAVLVAAVRGGGEVRGVFGKGLRAVVG